MQATLAGAPGVITRDELADTLGWPLARLVAALAELERHLESGGTRLDAADRVVYGPRPRHGLLTEAQRLALHRHRGVTESLSETAARGLYAIALLDGQYSEFTASTAIYLARAHCHFRCAPHP